MEHSGELEKALLGARLELTRREVAAEAGVTLEQAQQVWSAMGLPEVPDDERAFTGRDVDALRTFAGLRSSGLVDVETSLVLARAMGQGLSRLAEAQVEAFRALSAGMTLQEATEVATTSAEQVMPRLEQLVVHVWRRQFAAAVTRSLAYAGQEGLPVLAVGFVDLVDFTRSARSWDSATLQRLLERFERDTSLRVTAAGGRVVKTLGDEVLYVSDDAASAVEVALQTVAAHEADHELPSVRAGVALGPVLIRLGDVFGQPVNRASRLTDEARPGTLLVDDLAAAELDGQPSYAVKALRRRSVRGYRALTPHLVRRAGAEQCRH